MVRVRKIRDERGVALAERVSIIDVANRAGVSISSVSAALNGGRGVSEATRHRILGVANDLGWVPSMRGRSLSGKRAFAVGLVVQRQPEVLETDPFFAGFIGGVESVLESRGQALVLQVSSDRSKMFERYRTLALGMRVDGVFLSEIESEDPRIPLLEGLNLPAVAINMDRGTGSFPTVRQDHVPGMTELLQHLIVLGHRRIAHISGSPTFIHSKQREETWRSVLTAAGLTPGPVVAGDFTTESGARAANTLMASADPPTAVVCANDLMAIGFMARAADLGLTVPTDVSVTGYDGIKMGAYIRPPLTTVQTSPRDIGREAALLLLRTIDGEPADDVEITPAKLVLRESVAAAKV